MPSVATASSDETQTVATIPTANNNGETKLEEQNEDVVPLKTLNLKLSIPGNNEQVGLEISNHETVQEVRQVVLDRPESCFRTCFSLQIEGNRLDDFIELHAIDGLNEDSVIKVVDEPYSVREARIHIRRLRDLLNTSLTVCAFSAVDNLSLSFYSAVASVDVEEEVTKENKEAANSSVNCDIPEFAWNDENDVTPLKPLVPDTIDTKLQECLNELKYSTWNPPPGYRRLAGDLLYLEISTLEDNVYGVTASSTGFFVNRNTPSTFDPRPHSEPCRAQTLVGLLNLLSPLFKKNFSLLQRQSMKRHPLEVLPCPYQVNPWISPRYPHSPDAFRAEDAVIGRVGYEEQIPGQLRDWNEELQSAKELPKESPHQRLLRDRALFKITSDFVSAATKGAVAVVDGNVLAINPGEEENFACDSRDHYKTYGGDEAAYVAAAGDLRGVKTFNQFDIDGLHTLGTVLIDYRGYRVVAQSIIPGILQREQENSVVYGSIDGAKSINADKKFIELLSKSASPLCIRPSSLINEKDEEITLQSSFECKGIIGADGRHYILDLFKTCPPDTNFLEEHKDDENSEDLMKCPVVGKQEIDTKSTTKKFKYSLPHRHRLPTLRSTLVEAFVDFRYILFLRLVGIHSRQAQQKSDAAKKSIEDSNTEKLNGHSTEEKAAMPENTVATTSETTKEEKDPMNEEERPKAATELAEATKKERDEMALHALKLAAKAIGSSSETECDIRFNPDVFVEGLKYPESELPHLEKDKRNARDASTFLSEIIVGKLIDDFVNLSIVPLDGNTLTELMHARGINVRYLGKIASICRERVDLSHVYAISVMEMVLRIAKRQFKLCMQSASLRATSVAISHFLNCFLSSAPLAQPQSPDDELVKKRKNKKRGGKSSPSNSQVAWIAMTQADLWKTIARDTESHFGFVLPSVPELFKSLGFQKISYLRGICKSTGIQVLLREYDFENKKYATFNEDDIENLFPVVKHVNPKASDASAMFEAAQHRLHAGSFNEAHALLVESLSYFNQVYGPLHTEIVTCFRAIARLHYLADDAAQAVIYQKKALIVSERVHGIDHPETIAAYVHLALYCSGAGLTSVALRLMYRARYLALLAFGEGHPDLATFDTNIGLMLHSQGNHQLSLQFFKRALGVHLKYHGKDSAHTATSYHLVARAHACIGDYRPSLLNEKSSYAIFKKQFGDNDQRTKESSEYLKQVTRQAVVMQKTLNQIAEKTGKNSNFSITSGVTTDINILQTLNGLQKPIPVKIIKELTPPVLEDTPVE